MDPNDHTITNPMKDTNPKDSLGVRKVPMHCVSGKVLMEMGLGMMEGGRKYGTHNYRSMGVLASVYYDACMRHLMDWWEGQDIDPDSGMHHIAKLLSSASVLRDSMHMDNWIDDRPIRLPKGLDIDSLNEQASAIIDKYPNPKAPFTQKHEDIRGRDPSLPLSQPSLSQFADLEGVNEDMIAEALNALPDAEECAWLYPDTMTASEAQDLMDQVRNMPEGSCFLCSDAAWQMLKDYRPITLPAPAIFVPRRIYISHCIRGADGVNATEETMLKNSASAIEYAEKMRQVFPDIDFYCPGEHEDFITKAYRDGILTEQQILDIDCQIVDTCDAMLLFLLPDKHISRGMQVEIDHANKTGKPVMRSDDQVLNLEDGLSGTLIGKLLSHGLRFDQMDNDMQEAANDIGYKEFEYYNPVGKKHWKPCEDQATFLEAMSVRLRPDYER